MTMKSFSWDKYLERISVNPEHVTNNSWRVALLDRSVNVAAKLFHTAYYVSKNVQDGRYAVSWDEINALNLGTNVSSAYFWQYSDRLREQMNDVGAKLLRLNNENQYIRTIAFYSGVAVVKVIQKIAEDLIAKTEVPLGDQESNVNRALPAQTPITIQVNEPDEIITPEPQPGHLVFKEGETGVSYDSLFALYIKGARKIVIRDPYIRNFRQERNVMEFMETVFWNRHGDEKVEVVLETVIDSANSHNQIQNFKSIRDSFAPEGIDFTWSFPPKKMHARSITTDTGWKISLDRGLDIFDPSSSDMNDAFSISNRIQSRRHVRAFEITYMKVDTD